ncbi:glycosyl transferase [Peptostreptococcaceae bacterium AGR-M142]
MLNFVYLLLFFVGYIGSKFIIPMFNKLLIENNIKGENYLNKEIPVSMGISLIPFTMVNLIIHYMYFKNINVFLFFMCFISMTLIGFMDDIMGSEHKGLKGHIKELFKLNLTTGGFKAIFGFLISFIISYYVSSNWTLVLINTILMALFTNFVNLTDLRPGRAIKTFLFLGFLIAFINIESINIFIIVLPCVFAYFKDDLKALSMLGDSGANPLGMTIGFLAVFYLDFNSKLICLTLLIILHIISEKYSFSKIIKNNKVLNYIDMLGRN